SLFAPHCGDPDRSGEQRSTLFAPHCADSDRSGEARVNSGASFTVPVGVSTLWRTRGKLARVRRAAPRPARHPLGGSAQVLLRRGAVIHRGESWSRSAGPPQARRHPLGGSAHVLVRRGAVMSLGGSAHVLVRRGVVVNPDGPHSGADLHSPPLNGWALALP